MPKKRLDAALLKHGQDYILLHNLPSKCGLVMKFGQHVLYTLFHISLVFFEVSLSMLIVSLSSAYNMFEIIMWLPQSWTTAFKICLRTQQLPRLLPREICIFPNMPQQIIAVAYCLKGYLCYKTITSQNELYEEQVKIFLFHRKVMFHSQDIQVLLFLAIPWFTKFVTRW